MVWKIFWFSPSSENDDRAPSIIRMSCDSVASETEARVSAMRHYDRRTERVSVRGPGSARPIGGMALEEWLTDSLFGPV